MRRKLLIGTLSLLALISLLALALFWYIRSGRLDRYLHDEVTRALLEVGVRAEIAGAHLDLRGYRVELTGINLFAEKNDKHLASIERIVAEFSVVSYLKQKVEITRVEVVRPRLLIEIDPQGRTSIDTLHAPPERKDKTERIKLTDAYVEVTGGKLTLIDRRRDINLEVPDFFARFNSPDEAAAAAESAIDDSHSLELRFNAPAAVAYKGREVDDLNVTLKGVVGETAAYVSNLKVTSSLGSTTLSGSVPGYKPFKYDFNFESTLALDEVARVVAPDIQLGGAARVAGKITGEAPEYSVSANVVSDWLVAEGFRVASLRADARVSGRRNQYSGTADITTGPVSGRGIDIPSVRLTRADASGVDTDFNLAGALAVGTVKSNQVTVNGLRGRLTLEPDRFGLSGFTASALGGTLTGSVSVGLDGAPSRIDVRFDSMELARAAELASAREVNVRGLASGSAQLTFPRLEYRAATGQVYVNFDGIVSPPGSDEEATQAKGELNLRATGNGFRLEKAVARLAGSEVRAEGNLDWEGGGTVDVQFDSQDMAEVQRLIDGFNLIPERIKEQYEVSLNGSGSFSGRVQGRFSAPGVSGHLRLDAVKTHETDLGAFEGDIAYDPTLVRITGASLARADGSRASFSIVAPLEVENNISVTAQLHNFDLPAIVRAALPGLNDVVGRGAVTGTVDLTGLPNKRTVSGTAALSLTDAEFTQTSEDDTEAPKKILVPEFKGEVTLANSELTVKNLSARIGENTTLSGRGQFNLDTYAYDIKAEGEKIDLATLSERLGDTVKLSGAADLKLTGQGRWEEWSQIDVKATVQGKNVALNGRDLGDAKLSAYTDNGVLKLEATGRVLDEWRSLVATVDLRERNVYPINGKIEFADTDIAPYLGLVSPDLATLEGRATGVIAINGPLQEPDRIQLIATLSKLELGSAISERQRYTIKNQNDVVVRLSPNEVTIDSVTLTGEGTSITVGGTLAREEITRSNLTIDGEISLRFLSSFSQTVFTTGVAAIQATITGSLDQPRLRGSVDLKDVGVRVLNLPFAIARGRGKIRFTSDQALLEDFVAATPGGGSVTITGGAALSGLLPERWSLSAEADQVAVEYPRDTQTVFDATFTLRGNRRIQVLSGDAQVRRAVYTKDITIEELARTGGPFSPEFIETGPGGSGPGGPEVKVDVRVDANNTILVRNNLADAVGSAYLNITGPIVNPIVAGRVQFTRGTIEFRQGRHELTRALLTIPGKRGAEPLVDFQSEAEISGYRVFVGFNGTLDRLYTTLRSEPELPEQDILSLVLTGSLAGSRGPESPATQTGLGLAQSLLAAGISEQLQRGTQRLFGLSRFAIDPLVVGRSNDPTARITVGQRITKELTITYSQNLTSSGSEIDRIVLFEYRISNRFSLVGFRNERSEFGFDVRLRKRF